MRIDFASNFFGDAGQQFARSPKPQWPNDHQIDPNRRCAAGVGAALQSDAGASSESKLDKLRRRVRRPKRAGWGALVLLDPCSDSSSSQAQFTAFRDQVREALGRLSVHAEYTDIYGTTLPAATRDLKWFRRTLG